MSQRLIPAIHLLRRILRFYSYAEEVVCAYEQDAVDGRLVSQRLRGFVDGLVAAQFLDPCDASDVEQLIYRAESEGAK